MADGLNLTEERLARIAQQHIDSLKAAGIQWLPAAPGSLPSTDDSVTEPTDARPASGSLFGNVADEMPLDIDERRHELKVLAERVSRCTRCAELVACRSKTVFGVGRLDPEICFVGEGPGADEDAKGEPFVGPAGQLLNRIIAACEMKREEVYICNIVKCRPPGNRTPVANEAANCREYLERQLELIRPKFICALGACAAQNLLNTTLSITRLRGQIHDYRGIPVFCTYHPAYLLRSPDKKKDVWDDMKKLLRHIGRPVD